ncbi:UNVERIFIED_CONTAM: histidine kinase, partial [Prevotella sp. 15_C9]
SMKRINDFNACYDECTQVIEQYGVIRKTAVQRLHIYKLILNKNYDQAHTEADSLRNLLSANQMHHEIYLKSGNYEKAYIYNNWLHNYQDSVN